MKTRFVGRAADMDRLVELCESGASIVTLWGPPGIGKTRLAIELCRREGLTRCGEPAAVTFCDLSAARDAADIHRVVSVPSAPGVIVLDDFERVAHLADETVAKWAERAPHVLFLVTSRVRLRIEGEIAHEVMSLPEAAELFVDRARAASHAVATSMNPETVGRVVERLEGIPLAIELAAARVDLLGIEGLLARLSRPLEVLSRGAALRSAITSSFALLAPAEQSAYAQCAAFRGTFSIDAAEAVVDLPNVLDLLEAIHDRSLLRCANEGFAFYDAIRAHACEILDARDDVTAIRRRHAEWCLSTRGKAALSDVTEAARFVLEEEPPGGEERVIDAVARIDASLVSDALLALLERALERATTRRAIARGRHALGRAFHLRGALDDAVRELERALAAAEHEDGLSGRIKIDIGIVHHQRRDLDRAAACYESALAELDDRVARARCVGNLGAVHHDRRAWDDAHACYERALVDLRVAGERRYEGIFLVNLAVLLQERGTFGRARSTYAAAMDALATAGDRRFAAIARTNLGSLLHEMGSVDEAVACQKEALAALRELVDPRSEALASGRLAMALESAGMHDEARTAIERADRMAAQVQDPIATGVLLLYRAFVDGDEAAASDVRARMPLLLDVSDDARTAIRLLEARVAHRSDRDVLVVGPEARWILLPSGERHDLESRRVLQRLIRCLVEHHHHAPGEGVTLDVLREAGWPDDRALAEAAVNRVHVALTELRRRGLRAWLLRRGHRYLLDPALRVECADV